MKGEHLTMAIVALAAVAYPGTATGSPAENRYVNAGNRANGATDSHRENLAGATRKHSNNGETQERWKRAFAPWNGEHSEYKTFTSFSVWKPPVYQLSRPYYIPVYGAPGRIPVYFAPQPFDYDPVGYPPNNKPPFMGPPYLPPVTPTTQAPPETTMTVKTRFDFDDEDDDRPVWDQKNGSGSNVPTRPPPPAQGIPEFPPLVHDAQNSGTIQLSAQDEEIINEIFNQDTFRNTEAPPPRTPSTQAPPQRSRPPSTARPSSQSSPAQPQGPSGPSNCVWAVVSCCSAATNVYPERCFEQRGCPGPFWGTSPCDTEFAKAAVAAALNYYDQ